MFYQTKRTKEINNLPVVRDCHNKIIPKEISPMPGEVLLFNEWFTDELMMGDQVDPSAEEDSIIARLDAHRAGQSEESVEQPYMIRQGTGGLITTKKDISVKQFDVHALAKQTLNKQERRIFELIFIDKVSYRKAEEILGIDHCKIFNDYRKILKKLGNKIMRLNK